MAQEFRYVTTNLYQSGSTANPIIAELPLTGVSYTDQLNSVGTFQGHLLLSGANSLNYNAYDGTIPGKTILWVLYTDKLGNNSVVWSGVIWGREYDGATQTLSITAQQMMSLYNRRRISVDKDYSYNPSDPDGYDPTYIAQQLMIYAEGLTHGKTGLNTSLFVNSTAYRTKKLYEGYQLKSVYAAIKDLSANFFDFKIAPGIDVDGNLVNYLHMDDPLGSTYSATDPYALVFSFPGNLVDYKYPEDASSAANKLYGLGYGDNTSKIVAVATDQNKIGSTGDWPLLEDTTNFTDIGELQLLKDLTLGQLNAISYPPTTIEAVIPTYIDPIYPGYVIGDQVRLDVKDDYFYPYLNGEVLRIVAISVQPGENGPSRVTLTLTKLLASGVVT